MTELKIKVKRLGKNNKCDHEYFLYFREGTSLFGKSLFAFAKCSKCGEEFSVIWE